MLKKPKMEIQRLRGKSKDEIMKLFHHHIETNYDSDEWIIVSKSWFGLVTYKHCVFFDHEGKVEGFFGFRK